jgi:hypothetical protein
MKSVKFKTKFNTGKVEDSEFIKAKKKAESPTKAKVSLKSKKVWEDIYEDVDLFKYRIKGL